LARNPRKKLVNRVLQKHCLSNYRNSSSHCQKCLVVLIGRHCHIKLLRPQIFNEGSIFSQIQCCELFLDVVHLKDDIPFKLWVAFVQGVRQRNKVNFLGFDMVLDFPILLV
jgi:hypothetical protein